MTAVLHDLEVQRPETVAQALRVLRMGHEEGERRGAKISVHSNALGFSGAFGGGAVIFSTRATNAARFAPALA